MIEREGESDRVDREEDKNGEVMLAEHEISTYTE